ncbi:Pr6Pr family membrane protein [Pedobacter sp. Hv1]|uniref:Pr6Pr family membrane protein n=1 Tax=Pedobacter sp. Hv1 TaxID=1740090 RepID=UPI0006D8A011|nr:Pr6Pr family membrane protein [Pedobacter sp. Hv1]KQC02629.1 hypothetical protein AQF98_03370 [Pedobacter sp. Hv1]
MASSPKISALLLAIIAWFGIILQLSITAENYLNVFSYFTILSNVLVAVSLTCYTLIPDTKLGRYFSSISVQSAIALYIFIVGLVYNLVLRGIWEPKGWQLVADDLLHVITPVLYMLYWLAFMPKGRLIWKDGIVWAYFPLAYLIYSLVRGHLMGWYPYPFLNVTKLGYQKVFINSGLMVIAFVVIGLLLITFNKFLGKKA